MIETTTGLRNSHGICPHDVIRFLIELFKYNDNSKNHYSDCYYRAALVDALGKTVTPVVSMVHQGAQITAESLSADTKLVLDEITRILNLEKVLPCYKNVVSISCLHVIRKLQKCGHLPSRSNLFRAYAQYGQYIDIRLAALECLVDFVRVDGKWDDLEHLMDIIETDQDPKVRHALVRMLITKPPFDKGHRHRLDREALVERIWNNINGMLSHDTRLRCDLVDLYFALYGSRRPQCIQAPEIASMMKIQRHPKARSPVEIKHTPTLVPPMAQVPSLKRRAESPIDIKSEEILKQPFIKREEIGTEQPPVREIVDYSDVSEPVQVKMEIDVETIEPKREYCSDNSVPLPEHIEPGIEPVLEPGIKIKEESNDTKHKSSDTSAKPKKKKKDKKKHKHKHKHKHGRDKDKKSKDMKRDTAILKAQMQDETQETLSSVSSTPSPSSVSQDMP